MRALLALLPLVCHGADVRSVLEKRCVACHSGKLKKGNLDLTSREGALKGGDRGPAIVPGDARSSLLFKAVEHSAEPRMPFGSAKLTIGEIDAIQTWIDSGAPAFKTGAVRHWAFVPPKRAAAPSGVNAIDHFVNEARKGRGLTVAKQAGKRTLLRRVTLDLTGLPPTIEETHAFLEDSKPDAYERTVDRLLAGKQYGERWGRHFMDIWRYSDWYGYRRTNELRFSQKHIWHWRDWIVDAFNSNKPYDRMIQEMLAGDEIDPSNPDTLRATGFLARNYNRYDRNGWMQDAVDHTAMAFLGVTVKCARCHDHKYDPVSQEEYYKLRAFFEPYNIRTDRIPGQPDRDKDGIPRIYDGDAKADTFFFIRGDVQNPDKNRKLTPGVPEAFGGMPLKIAPVRFPLDAHFPDSREFVRRDVIQAARDDVEKATPELKEIRQAVYESVVARVEADRAKLASTANAADLAEAARKVERRAALLQAELDLRQAQQQLADALKASPLAEAKINQAKRKVDAAQSALAKKPEQYTPLGDTYPAESTGRRLALAKWIVSRENPLTARVAMNHLWMRHFGKPLVPTVFDFGLNGKAPTHPELLDWLAVEFMESGWDIKRLHRLMVTSAVYRLASATNSAEDPENVYLAHANIRRMESEAVRDSILRLSGRLDSTIGGPEIDEARALKSRRRSIYFRHAPDLQAEFLRMFDSPNPHESYQRYESIVPQQALSIANSELSQAESRVLARRIWDTLGPKAASATFIERAYESVLNRPPRAAELAKAREFLDSQAALLGNAAQLTKFTSGPVAETKPSEDPAARARENLVHVLFNLSEFVTIQ